MIRWRDRAFSCNKTKSIISLSNDKVKSDKVDMQLAAQRPERTEV